MKQTIRSLKYIRRPAYALLKRRVPGQLVIQFTDRCNALCPQCGMRIRETFTRSKLSISAVKRILDRAAQRNVSLVSFTGGEPFLYLDEPALLIAHPGHNSLPAALEILARLQREGAAGRIFYLTGPDDERGWRQIAEAVHDLEVRRDLRRARIGLIGAPSDWLIASSPTPEVVRETWGRR